MKKDEFLTTITELFEEVERGEEPTNGEVILALFPGIEPTDMTWPPIIETKLAGGTTFLRRWWNAPYVGKGEN